MSDALLALQTAIYQTLSTDSAVTALVADRIFDSVPPKAPFPYIEIGDGQEIDDQLDDYLMVDVSIDLHIFSRAVGKPEASDIYNAVRNAMRAKYLALDSSWRMATPLMPETRRTLSDPDGVTTHIVTTYTCKLDSLV